MTRMCALRLAQVRLSHLPKNFLVKQSVNKGIQRSCRWLTTLSAQQYPKNERVEVGPYFINYIKVGHGPHVVFCYPGILGCFQIQVHSLISGFNREKFTFVSWDQPGYGLSRPPERVFTDDSLEEDSHYVAKFMHILGYDKYSVMGWSGGGCSAMLFAINYPQIIRKLVVWGAFSYANAEDAEIFKWFTNPANTGGKMLDILIEYYGETFFRTNFNMWMNLFQRIYTVRHGELCSKRLHEISAPTLALHGLLDNLVKPRHSEFINANIPNSRLEIWEKGRHNLHLRYPERFNEVVQGFLLE